MIKLTETYTDYLGNTRTEDFRFNLSEAECMKLETSIPGGLTGLMQKIIDTQDTPELMKIFEKIVLEAYGEMSLDGRKFIKNDQVREDFVSTEAYSQIYVRLATNSEAAVAFMNGIIPNKQPAANPVPAPTLVQGN